MFARLLQTEDARAFPTCNEKLDGVDCAVDPLTYVFTLFPQCFHPRREQWTY
jgi:hypothetical protein